MVAWTAGASLVLLVLGAVATPMLVVRLPADYFKKRERGKDGKGRGPGGGWAIVKNVVGWVLIVAGAAMLVLPGPGLLVVLIGVMLADFPGKYRIERWIISRRGVFRGANWLRRKFGQPPLAMPSSG